MLGCRQLRAGVRSACLVSLCDANSGLIEVGRTFATNDTPYTPQGLQQTTCLPAHANQSGAGYELTHVTPQGHPYILPGRTLSRMTWELQTNMRKNREMIMTDEWGCAIDCYELKNMQWVGPNNKGGGGETLTHER
jgi:hypothetical protein